MEFFLWTQHLNNVSPDIIANVSETYKEVLKSDERSKIIAKISSITSSKNVLTHNSTYSTAYLRNKMIVFDVKTEDQDSGGRDSNITGYYQGFEQSGKNELKDIVEKLRDFGSRNNRAISEEALKDLVECLNEIQRKQKSKKMKNVLLVTGIVLLILLITVLLYQNHKGSLEQAMNGENNEQSESNSQ